MKQTYNWQDVYLFLAVARHTGLAGAAADTKFSAATLSRRMINLEHDLEQRLFERGARGYALTPAGKALFERAEKMEMAAQEIGHLHNQSPVKRRIKISAGSWTMQLLLNNIGKYWSEDDNWLPEFVANNARLDIARRQIDIGIRNAKPSEPWLATRRVGYTNYAAYRLAGSKADIGWVAVTGDNALTPTARYTIKHHSEAINFTISQPTLGLPMVLKGLAQMILPEFVGASYPELVRDGGFIDELKADVWLVMHQDERNHPPVRKAIDAVTKFLKEDYLKFNG